MNNDEKIEYIKKWFNGEKLQYKLSLTPDDDKTWHNFTEKSMKFISRSDFVFRNKPKYLVINGVKFESLDKLIAYAVKNYSINR